MPRSLFLALIGASLFLQTIASPVLAHAALVSAVPGPDEEVAGSPDELVIRFSQDLDPSRTSIEVLDGSGARVARGGELGSGPREFRLALPDLTPGEYEVRWTSFSAEDGELARDTYSFTVVAAPSPSATAVVTPTPAPAASALPTATSTVSPSPSASPSRNADVTDGDTAGEGGASVIVPILAALLVIGGIAVRLLRRRPS